MKKEGSQPDHGSEQGPAWVEPHLTGEPDLDTYDNVFGETVINRTPKSPTPPPGVIPYTRATDIQEETLEWVWRPYLPLGKLVMLDGDPGTGKSSLSCWIAARVSTGRDLVEQPGGEPRNVLMLSAEDGLGDTVKPRLRVMEADMNRVYVSDAALTLNPQGLDKLDKTIAFLKPMLVFIDPIVFYMGGDMDMNRANEVRKMTGALSMMAARRRSTIVLVRHLRKQASATAIYRGQGTIDFVGAARSVLMLERRSSGKTVMEHTKANLGRRGTTLAYTVDEDGRFLWGAPVAGDGSITTKPKLQGEAIQFLQDALKSGPLSYVELRTQAEARGIGERTLERAKPGVAYSKKDGKNWVWALAEKGAGTQNASPSGESA